MAKRSQSAQKALNISVLNRKQYDALFLSDIHFLVSNRVLENSHNELLELLASLEQKRVRFRDIFLVGDIVENWYFSAAEARTRNPQRLDRLFDLIEALWNRDGSLYFITGNHDTTSFNQGLSTWLSEYLEKRNWVLCNWYQNAHFIAIHGHQGQYGKFSWIMNILGVRIMYGLGKIIPGLFGLAEKLYNGNLNHRAQPSTKQQEQYYARLSRIVHRRDRLMITGHTHEFLCLPDQKILNTGDWLESRTLVIQDRKTFRGYRLVKRNLKCEYEHSL